MYKNISTKMTRDKIIAIVEIVKRQIVLGGNPLGYPGAAP